MAKQTINIGASPNDGTGTPLRTAFDYTNQNFTELYTATGPSGNNIVVPGNATITGALTVGNGTSATQTFNGVTNILDIGFGSLRGGSAYGDVRLWTDRFRIYNNAGTQIIKNISGTNGDETWFDGAGGTRMTLNSTGLGVGQVPSTSKLEVGITNTSTAGLIEANSLKIENNNATVNNAAGLFLSQTGNAGCGIAGIATSRTGGSRTSDLVLYYYNQATSASPIEGLRLNSAGNCGIGVTPSAWDSNFKALQIGYPNFIAGNNGGNRLDLGVNAYFSTNYKYAATGSAASFYSQAAGQHQWFNAPSGTAGNAITFTQAMTLDASGRLILLASTTTPATLATNGQLTFTATSDTNLRFSYRGSDGVTRTANLTLAP